MNLCVGIVNGFIKGVVEVGISLGQILSDMMLISTANNCVSGGCAEINRTWLTSLVWSDMSRKTEPSMHTP